MGVAAALPILLGIGGAVAANKFMGPAKISTPSLPELPKAPKPADAQQAGADVIRKKRSSFSQSIYTSPLGVSGQANVAKKTLLGT